MSDSSFSAVSNEIWELDVNFATFFKLLHNHHSPPISRVMQFICSYFSKPRFFNKQPRCFCKILSTFAEMFADFPWNVTKIRGLIDRILCRKSNLQLWWNFWRGRRKFSQKLFCRYSVNFGRHFLKNCRQIQKNKRSSSVHHFGVMSLRWIPS